MFSTLGLIEEGAFETINHVLLETGMCESSPAYSALTV